MPNVPTAALVCCAVGGGGAVMEAHALTASGFPLRPFAAAGCWVDSDLLAARCAPYLSIRGTCYVSCGGCPRLSHRRHQLAGRPRHSLRFPAAARAPLMVWRWEFVVLW